MTSDALTDETGTFGIELGLRLAAHPALIDTGVPELVRGQRLVADATRKFVLRSRRGPVAGFIVCSPPSAPQLVTEKNRAADEARAILGPLLGKVVLPALAEGQVDGLTFAVYPYCLPLSNSRVVWYVQRRLIRPQLLKWLLDATRHTRRPARPEEIEHLVPALERLAALGSIPERIASLALDIVNEIATNRWRPDVVLMHSDLWKGNVMLSSDRHSDASFVVIDWPVGDIWGYPIYDFLRLAQSLRLSRRRHEAELAKYLRLLLCDREGAARYLVCALATLAANAGEYPEAKIASMVELCYRQLETGRVERW